MSRSSRKRKRAERRRKEERRARKKARAAALKTQEEELDLFGVFINTIGVELLLPKARVVIS